MSLSTFFSSLLPSAKCDAPEEKEEKVEETKEEGKEEGGKEAAEEEEEEPEDLHPALREECAESAKCVQFTKHFQHCQEKVEAGEGFKGEDCVEEMCKWNMLSLENLRANEGYVKLLTMISPHDALRRQLRCAKTMGEACLSPCELNLL